MFVRLTATEQSAYSKKQARGVLYSLGHLAKFNFMQSENTLNDVALTCDIGAKRVESVYYHLCENMGIFFQ